MTSSGVEDAALEVGVAGDRVFAPAVARADARLLRALAAASLGRSHRVARRPRGRRGRRRRLVARLMLLRQRGRRHVPHAFAEHRHADHADVLQAASARRIRIRQRRELEGGDARHVLAPAGDLRELPARQHVAGLVRRGGLARDHIDAVHRNHRQHAPAAAVGQRHGVAAAWLARHPPLPVVPVGRQGLARGAVRHGAHVDGAADRVVHPPASIRAPAVAAAARIRISMGVLLGLTDAPVNAG